MGEKKCISWMPRISKERTVNTSKIKRETVSSGERKRRKGVISCRKLWNKGLLKRSNRKFNGKERHRGLKPRRAEEFLKGKRVGPVKKVQRKGNPPRTSKNLEIPIEKRCISWMPRISKERTVNTSKTK